MKLERVYLKSFLGEPVKKQYWFRSDGNLGVWPDDVQQTPVSIEPSHINWPKPGYNFTKISDGWAYRPPPAEQWTVLERAFNWYRAMQVFNALAKHNLWPEQRSTRHMKLFVKDLFDSIEDDGEDDVVESGGFRVERCAGWYSIGTTFHHNQRAQDLFA